MDAVSDEALLAGLAGGDPDAASAFVGRYQRRVFGLASTIVRDRGLAEAVAQEALVRAWRHAASFDLSHVPYAVLDQSRSRASIELLARLDGTGVFERSASLESPQQISDAVERDGALLVLSIPADFESRLASGQPAPLQVILDGRNSSTAAAASAYVGAIVGDYNRSIGVSSPITLARPSLFARLALASCSPPVPPRVSLFGDRFPDVEHRRVVGDGQH